MIDQEELKKKKRDCVLVKSFKAGVLTLIYPFYALINTSQKSVGSNFKGFGIFYFVKQLY